MLESLIVYLFSYFSSDFIILIKIGAQVKNSIGQRVSTGGICVIHNGLKCFRCLSSYMVLLELAIPLKTVVFEVSLCLYMYNFI